MKKTINLFIVLFVSIWSFAQSNVQNTMVYSLPKTMLSIEVETEKVTHVPGVFYRYSERYLATKDVVTEEKTSYSLKNIRVNTEAVPDANRTYSISWNTKKAVIYNIAINEKGILCGINTTCEPKTQTKKKIIRHQTSAEKQNLLPMGEEYMQATSRAKMAELVAKQIYSIRENRIMLLAGDVEHYPDGEAFALLMKEMDKMERELTELFVGKVVRETQTHTIEYTPENPNANEILFRLSALNGIVPFNDLSGAPYYINIATTPLQLAALPQERSNPVIRTIYPASAKININNGTTAFFSGDFCLPQFGTVVELTDNLLRNEKVKVHVDTETGRLLSIE